MNIEDLTKRMNEFVKEKGWYDKNSPRPQTPRNLSLSLHLETSEILELFQWGEREIPKSKLAGELADVALYLLQLASVSDIDLEDAILRKLRENYRRTWPTERG
jgi:NTP pyrophosphatase (non-canonical NTP hydrolase)